MHEDVTDTVKQIQGVLVKAGLLESDRAREERGQWAAFTSQAWAAGMRRIYPDSPEAHRASLNAQPQTLRATVRQALLALAPPREPSPPKPKKKAKKPMADQTKTDRPATETSNPISPPQENNTQERGKTVGSDVEKGDDKK